MPEETKDNEIIDFKKVKDSVKKLLKKFDKKQEQLGIPNTALDIKSQDHSQPQNLDDNISLDFSRIKKEFKKQAHWIIPVLCILIAMSFSIYLRTMPQRLPIAGNWAENTIQDFYGNQIEQRISKEYPHLPQQNLQVLVDQEWQKFKEENQQLINSQKDQLREQYKDIFKNDEGISYLLGIDPYYYYRQTEYVLKNGFPGTSVKDGVLWDDYRLAPLGREAEWNFHNWFSAVWHKFLNLFGDFPLMFTFFYVGTIFSALTIIPGFFIGRRITNNSAGGFFVAMLLAVSAFFVSRTTGESSDTDVYAVFFPVLITWLFLEAMDISNKRSKFIWAGLAGLATGIFAFAWTGWWYIATFIVVTMVFNLLHNITLQMIHNKKLWLPLKSSELAPQLYLLGTYLLSGGIFVSLFISFNQFIKIIRGPFQFLTLKAVGSYWPNIRTTVAELNVASFSNVLEHLGGKWFLMMSLIVVIVLLFRKNKDGKRELYLPLFIVIWLTSSLFATTKGVRFVLQATPIFAIAAGSLMGLIWEYGSYWIHRELKLNQMAAKIILFVILCLLLIQPVKDGYSQAFNSVPSMNDGWYDALTKIKNEAPENIVITSWWDFGHWFKAVADRPVTFDGGTQTPWGAYWVGKSLLISDENSAAGIIRMLNCGQNNAFNELDAVLQDTPKSIGVINKIVAVDASSAANILKSVNLTSEQVGSVLKYTHCENPAEGYYITSADMIGKAGVWGHFGSWNFNRAVMHKETRNLAKEQAIPYLINKFALSSEEAETTYAEIISTDADRWIAPWPGFLTGIAGCNKVNEDTIHCSTSFQDRSITIVIGLNSLQAKLGDTNITPNSLVYATPEGVTEQKFEGEKVGFSIVLIPDDNNGYNFLLADPSQAAGVFTRLFFLKGHGLKCFSKFDDRRQFDNQKIITWKVDYNCEQENKVYFNS